MNDPENNDHTVTGTTDGNDITTFLSTYLRNGYTNADNPLPIDPAYLGADDFNNGYVYFRDGNPNNNRTPAVDGNDLSLILSEFLRTVGDVTNFH